MPIQVNIRKAELMQRGDGTPGLALVISTTHSDYPGQELRCGLVFATSLTAAQIKGEINTAVTLLWQAHDLPAWTI